MSQIVSFGSISQRTAAWASKEMLEHAMPIEVLARFAQAKPIPRNTADGASFRRPVPFAPATTALLEGVTPPGHSMQYENVTVQLQQFGDFVEITDRVKDLAEDPVLKDAASLSGEQAAETMEVILWGILRAGTAVSFMGGGANRNTVNTPLNGAAGQTALRNVSRALKAQRAKYVTEMLAGTPNYKMEPVGAGWIAFAHTDVEPDLRTLPNFVPVELYGQSVKALPYEVGKFENFRFILSPLLAPWVGQGGAKLGMKSSDNSTADVYPVVVVGRNSYANVSLRGANAMTPLVLNPGVPRGGDPLGQRGTVGWKSYYAAMILNQAWIYRLEVAVTA